MTLEQKLREAAKREEGQFDYVPDFALVDLLIAAADANRELVEGLRAMTEHYVALVDCGDCGNWNPEGEPEVIQARALIAKMEGR